MRKRTCRHENAYHLTCGDFLFDFDTEQAVEQVYCEQLRCAECYAWLSLGQANDEDESVKLELRAAEIAAELADGGCEVSALERSGFNDEPLTLRGGFPIALFGIGTQAGHLARVICEHGDD